MKTFVQSAENGTAVFSSDRRHRYLLTRDYDGGSGVCCFVLLNPSSADAARNDPTIGRCSRFAQRWGYAKLTVVNLFSFMTHDPRLLARRRQKTTPTNDEHIAESASAADLVVVAWGWHGSMVDRSSQVRNLLASRRIELNAFGVTKNGEPLHPLYLPSSSTLSPFR